jgi:hypothetical protein
MINQNMIPVTDLLTDVRAILITLKLTGRHLTKVLVVNKESAVPIKPNLFMLQCVLIFVFAHVVAELSAGRSHNAVLGAFNFVVPIPDTVDIYLPIMGSAGFAIKYFTDISIVSP